MALPAFRSFMTLAIDKMDVHNLINIACHERLPKKTKVTWYLLQKDYMKDRVLYKSEWASV